MGYLFIVLNYFLIDHSTLYKLFELVCTMELNLFIPKSSVLNNLKLAIHYEYNIQEINCKSSQNHAPSKAMSDRMFAMMPANESSVNPIIINGVSYCLRYKRAIEDEDILLSVRAANWMSFS